MLIPVDADEPVVAPVITQVSLVTAQLSAVVGFAVAILLLHTPAEVVFVILAGHVIVGAIGSRTVTFEVQVETLPLLSVTVSVTGLLTNVNGKVWFGIPGPSI